MRKSILSILIFLGSFSGLSAAAGESISEPGRAVRDSVVDARLTRLETALDRYAKLDGVIKLRNEYNVEDGNFRFFAKNIRLGLKGNPTKFLSYRLQLELAHKFTLLDAYADFKPVKGMDIIFGQKVIPFINLKYISASGIWFSDSPLFTRYAPYTTRDMGLTLSYAFDAGKVPMSVLAAFYTGCNVNDKQWRRSPSYTFRYEIGRQGKGVRFAAKTMYSTRDSLNTVKPADAAKAPSGRYFSWGAEIDWNFRDLHLGGEYVNHNNTDSPFQISTALFQARYDFDIPKSKVFRKIIPAVKWDAVAYNIQDEGIDPRNIHRLTAGVTFAFEYRKVASHLRLDYEHSLCGPLPSLFVVQVMVAL